MPDDQFPVEWTGRQAIVQFPENVDVSNADRLRDRLLSVINRGATVMIADMTGTLSCDHAAVDALGRACQRATVSGTQFRLVVTAPVIKRVLAIEGLDRLVSIYPSLEAADAGKPGSAVPARPSAVTLPASLAHASRAGDINPAVLWQLIDALGDDLALTGRDYAFTIDD
jgi:anti-sigma B factor antagonist